MFLKLSRIATLILAAQLLPDAVAYAQLEAPSQPAENPTTEQKRILGKILFWDEQLSSDNTVACGTCHIPAVGGSDPRIGHHPGPDGQFSTEDDTVGSPGIIARNSQNIPVMHPLFGAGLQVTPKVSPGIFMSMYAGDMFWDGRARTEFIDPENPGVTVITSGGGLESQAVGPILSDVEMAHQDRSWTDVVAKLTNAAPLALAARIPPDIDVIVSSGQSYPELFAAAFGDPAISAARIGMAIAAYERTLVPDQTPWDRFMRGDQSAMTSSQIAGWTSYEADTVCDNCHTAPHFTDHQFYNIGLRPASEDAGRQRVTLDGGDFGRFKTPSLRNVGLRKSMTHVGWVTSLKDAVDFYNASALPTGHTQFTDFQSDAPAPNGGPTVQYALVTFFPGDDTAQAPVLDFLANALTDPRAATESFPFDRPLLGSERMTLLSFNLSGPTWNAGRADLVENVIRSSEADVVGLQEVDPGMLNDVSTRLADVYDAITFGGGASGEPLLVRRGKIELIDSGTASAALVCNGYETINYAVLRSIPSGESLVVLNNYLCPPDAVFPANEPGAESRNAVASVLIVESMLGKLNSGGAPAIAIGDFNATDISDSIEFLTGSGTVAYADSNPVELEDALRSVNPGLAGLADTQWSLATNDSTGLSIIDATVVDTADARAASDHQPLLITLAVDTTPIDINARPGDPSDTTAPSVPGGLAATSQTSSSIGLNWAAASDGFGVSHYRLYRDGGLLATMAMPGYSDTDVVAGMTYQYSVVAVDLAGNESASATLSARAQSGPITPPPAGRSSGGGQVSPVFLWTLLLLVAHKAANARRQDWNS